MEGVFARLGWFAVVAVLVAYSLYLIIGGMVNAQASGVGGPILIRDDLRANQHQLSGMVTVPTPCDQLSVKTEALSASTYALVFTTWHEPSVDCGTDPTPRAFRTTIFAPASGIYFVATLDGVSLPIAVVPIISGKKYQ